MRIIILIVLWCMGIGVTAAAADLAKPEVPDPYGLGERLALIDYLHEKMGANPPTGATLEELTALYWKLRHDSASTKVDDAALSHDRVQRLRTELKEVFKIDAPADADEATLSNLLAEQKKTQTDKELTQVIEKAAAHDHPADSAGRLESAGADEDAATAHFQSLQGDMRSLRAVLDDLNRQLAQVMGNLKQSQAQGDTQAKHENDLRNDYNKAVQTYNKDMTLANRQTMEAKSAADKAASDDMAQTAQATATIQSQADDLSARIAAQNKRINALDQQEAQAHQQIQQAHQRKESDVPSVQPAPGPHSAGPPADASSMEGRIKQSVVMLVVQGRGLGTGFFITKSGLLVTNAHVVGDDKNPTITATWDAQVHKATIGMHVVQVLPQVDLALLRADGSGPFQALVLHEQYELARPLVAVGFPLATAVARTLKTEASDIVMTRGTLSSVRHQGDLVTWLQHDCRIASGNSGGPLIDQESGVVIGVNSAVMSSEQAGGHGDGMSLAIPIRIVKESFSSYLNE